MLKKRHVFKGFTLIELLVVIAIIGILATLVISHAANSQNNARNSIAMSSVIEVGKGIETFKVAAPNDGFISNLPSTDNSPDTLQGTAGTLPQLFAGKTNTTLGSLTYAPSIQNTPNTNYLYSYTAPATLGAGGRQLLTTGSYIFSTNLVNGATNYFYVSNGNTDGSPTNPSISSLAITYNSCSGSGIGCVNPADGKVFVFSVTSTDGATTVASSSQLPYHSSYTFSLPPGNYHLNGACQYQAGTGGGATCTSSYFDSKTGQSLPEIVTVPVNGSANTTLVWGGS